MKKLIIVTVFILLCFSCSNDDGNKRNEEGTGGDIPADEKLLKSIAGFGDYDFEFTYNPDKSLKRLTIGQMFFNFSYNSGMITTVTVAIDGQTGVANFTHDAMGRIISFGFDNNILHEVVYDPAANTYTFDDTTLYLTADGYVYRYVSNNPGDNCLLLYIEEDDKKGPMVNTNKFQAYMAMVYPSIGAISALFSGRPADVITDGNINLTLINEYHNDGFVKKAAVNIPGLDEGRNIIYNYMQQ